MSPPNTRLPPPLPLRRPLLKARPSENFLFVDHPKEDHNEREFKPLIIDEILDLPKRSSKTKEASIISSPQLSIIVPIMKIFSEIIEASKCGPLAGLKNRMS